MFILHKTPTIIEHPWKMGVIEDALPAHVAEYLSDNFLSDEFEHQPQYNAYQKVGAANYSDPVFKEFFDTQWNSRSAINAYINKVFGTDHTDSELDQISFNLHKPADPSTVARDWHTDIPGKKFQMLLYLGNTTDTVTYEMTDNPEEGSKRSFTFQHNRLVFWQNLPHTYHKFYFTPVQRKTIVMTIHYKDKSNGYKGIPETLL